jgi:hypothetical protein
MALGTLTRIGNVQKGSFIDLLKLSSHPKSATFKDEKKI